jgi:hypothetical protein
LSLDARRGTWREHAGAVAVVALATVAFFAPVFFAGRSYSTVETFQVQQYPWASLGAEESPPQADQAALTTPWQHEVDRAVDDGTLAFWAGGTFGGYPFYSNGNTAQLYPFRWLPAVLDLSPAVAHELYAIGHLFLAGCAMYALLRELRAGWAGAVLGALSWMFSSASASWLHFEVIVPLHVFLPLGVLLVRRARRSGSRTSAMVAGVALGTAMTAGHVLWMAISCVIAGGDAVALAVGSARRAWRRTDREGVWLALRSPLLTAVTAAGTSAVVLLPTAMTTATSQRARFEYVDLYRYDATVGAPGLAPPTALLRLVTPWTTKLDVTTINTQMAFAGTLTAAFAVVAVLHRRRRGVALGSVVLATFALAAVGGPVTWLVYHLTPLGRVFRPYGRLFQWSAFGLAMLGGIGLSIVLDRVKRAAVGRDVPWLLRPRGIAIVVLAVTAAQLIGVSRQLNPAFASRAPEANLPATPVLEAMQALRDGGSWPARSIPISSAAPFELMLSVGSMGMVYDLDVVGGYDSNLPQRAYATTRYLAAGEHDVSAKADAAYFAIFYGDTVPYGSLTRFGVGALATAPSLPIDGAWGGEARAALRQRELYSGPDGNLIQIIDDDIGPHVVGGIEVVDDDQEAFDTFIDPRFAWRDEVVLTEQQARRLPAPLLAGASTEPLEQSADVVDEGPNSLVLAVEAERAGFLVIPANWDAGWTAEVDGRATPMFRGNYTQQVVPVPAGSSVVDLRYRPEGLVLGAAVSGATMLAVAAVATSEELRRRRRVERIGRHAAGARRRGAERPHGFDEELVGEQRRPHPEAEPFDRDEAPPPRRGAAGP